MLNQGPELAALLQTRLTLVVAMESGHNPVKASGFLFAYLAGICKRSRTDQAQAWTLNAASRRHHDPWEFLKRFAEHINRTAEDVWREYKLPADVFARNPLES
jgi:hypothetical protein